MSDIELCRLCANFVDDTNAPQLFEQNQKNLLRQAEELTGIELENTAFLPKFICELCQDQTQQAHEFRERCIRVQKQFAKAAATSKNKLIRNEIQEVKLDMIAAEVIEEVDEEKIEEIDEEKIEEFDEEKIEEIDEEKIEEIDEEKIEEIDEEVFEEVDNDNETIDADDDVCIKNEPINAMDDNDSSGSCYSLSFDHPDTADMLATKEGVSEVIELPPPKHPSDLKVMDKVALLIEEDKAKRMSRRRKKQFCYCDQCGERLKSQCFLIAHMRKHTGEKPFACRFCDRRFAMEFYRKLHERMHTNERPYVCSVCDKGFVRKQTLNIHMTIHTGERPFKCTVCNVDFSRKSLLKSHNNTHTHRKNLDIQKSLEIETNSLGEDKNVLQDYFDGL